MDNWLNKQIIRSNYYSENTPSLEIHLENLCHTHFCFFKCIFLNLKLSLVLFNLYIYLYVSNPVFK